MNPLEIQSLPRGESSDSIAPSKSLIAACKSDVSCSCERMTGYAKVISRDLIAALLPVGRPSCHDPEEALQRVACGAAKALATRASNTC